MSRCPSKLRSPPPPAEQSVVDAAPEPPALLWSQTVEVRRRDTVADLLKRSSLSAADAHALAKGPREAGTNLRRIRTGESVVRVAGGHAGNTRAVAMSIFASHG